MLVSLFIVLFHFLQVPEINNWAGKYYGVVDGKQAVLTVELDGNQLVGEVNAEGYYYQFTTAYQENNVTGYINDIQTGKSLMMSARKNNDEIIVTVEDVYYIFKSQEDKSVSKTTRSSSALNTELIGNWRFTEINTIDDYSVTTDYYLMLNKDGSYTYKIGDSDGEGESGNFSSGSNESHSGQWKSEKGAIYFQNNNAWEFFATYLVEEDILELSFEDGEQQTWNRQ